MSVALLRYAPVALGLTAAAVVAACKPPESKPSKPSKAEADATSKPPPSAAPESPLTKSKTRYTNGIGLEPGHRQYAHIPMVTMLEADLGSFNPLSSGVAYTVGFFQENVFRTVLRKNPETLQVDSDLGSLKQVDDKGKVYDIVVTQGIKWSDGQPFTAGDISFMLSVAFDKRHINRKVGRFKDINGNLPKVEQIDEWTVRLTYEEPIGSLPAALADFPIYPKHVWEKELTEKPITEVMTAIPKNLTRIVDGKEVPKMIGTGAYYLHNYTAAQSAELRRNPHYEKTDANGSPMGYIDRMVFQVVPDGNTRSSKFATGDVHLLDRVRPDQVDGIRNNLIEKEGAPIILYDGGLSTQINFVALHAKVTEPKAYVSEHLRRLFEQPEFRRAISHAINRENIVNNHLFSHGAELYCANTGVNKHWPNDCEHKFRFDKDEANRLLDELGLEERDSDGVRKDKEGNRIKFLMITNSEDHVRKKVLSVSIKKDLRAVGLDVMTQEATINSVGSRLGITGDWEGTLIGLTGGFDPAHGDNVLRSSGSHHFWNSKQKKPLTEANAVIDWNFDRLNQETDHAQRRRHYQRILDVLSEQQFFIFTHTEKLFMAAHQCLGNTMMWPYHPYSTYNLGELYWKCDPNEKTSPKPKAVPAPTTE